MGHETDLPATSVDDRRRASADGPVATGPDAMPSVAAIGGAPTGIADVLALQHSVGNQHTAALLGSSAPAPATDGGEAVAVSSVGGELVQRSPDAPSAAPLAVPLAVPAVDPDDKADIDSIVEDWGMVESVMRGIEERGKEILVAAAAAATGDKKKTKKVTKALAEFDTNVDTTTKALGQVMLQAVTCQVELEKGNAAAAAQIPAHAAALTDSLTQLLRALMDAAKLAHTFGDREYAAFFTEAAEVAKEGGGALDRGNRGQKAKTDHKGNLASVTTVADTGNNIGPGVVGGGVGGVEAVSGATVFGAVAGGIFGGLGILFGSIGVGLGIKAAIRGAQSEAELRALEPTLGSEELAEATAYAANKKRKKKEGGKAVAIGGGAAVLAGVGGLVALSVATLGLGAAILGVGAALIGLGFLIGRWIHKRSKRDKYATTLADALVTAAKDDTDPAAQADARGHLTDRGFDLTALGGPGEKAATATLVGVLKQEGVNRREQMAATVYDALVGDDVAEQIDAERVVEALHLDPSELRGLADSAAKSKIAGKMSSW